jgi:NAD(P)-dependent dehydrogenase (short-subunit alcohol dehydrogenase family)
MRANGGGRIVQCSSVLGLVALKWRGAYNAAKFAIEALSDTLRLELRGSGIHVSLIEPGPIESDFTKNALRHFEQNIDQANSHYQDAYARQRARLGRGGSARYKLGPEAVLEALVHAIESDRPRARYYVTKPTHYMAFARRILPQRLLDHVLDRASDQ